MYIHYLKFTVEIYFLADYKTKHRVKHVFAEATSQLVYALNMFLNSMFEMASIRTVRALDGGFFTAHILHVSI